MCSIPNIAIAKIESRGIVRLFLPNVESDSVVLSDYIKQRIYEEGILPARRRIWDGRLRTAPQNNHHHWPLTYAIAAGQHGQSTTRSVGVKDVPLFGTALLELLEEADEMFKGAFFGHEIQGTKLAYMHELDSDAQRRDMLADGLLSIFIDGERPKHPGYLEGRAPPSEVDGFPEVWLIDVALQFSSPGVVLHWSREGHARVLRLAYPHLTEADAARAIRQRGFRVDMAASLYQVSGWFSYRPKGRGSAADSHAVSAIAYSTVKGFWHKQGSDQGTFADPMPKDMLNKSSFEKLNGRLQKLISAIALAAGQEDPRVTQTGSARLETRVPVEHATAVLTTVPSDFFTENLLLFPASVFM